MRNKFILAGAGAAALVLAFGFGAPTTAEAAIVSVAAHDHPDGNIAPPLYGLRLGYGVNDPNGFSFDTAGSGVIFSFDPDANSNMAFLTGTVQHVISDGVDLGTSGGFYSITATFQNVTLTDNNTDGLGGNDTANPIWHGSETALYEDMLLDLVNNTDTISDTELADDGLDRVYFAIVDLTLTHVSGTNTYAGVDDPFIWDEFPNDPSKQFLLQKDYRLGDHQGTNGGQIAGAGWLEEQDPTESYCWINGYKKYGSACRRTSDFLFVLDTPTPPGTSIPEPATMSLFGAGLLGMGVAAWRRRRAAKAA